MKVLKELRIQKSFSSEQMAHKLDISLNTYYKYEQGRISPPVKRLKQICRILGCTVNDLI